MCCNNICFQVQAPVGKDRGPIFTAVSAPRGGGQFVPQRPPMGQLPLMQLGYDAAQLMAQEYRTMTIRRRHARIADLESQLANSPLPGFHQVRASFHIFVYHGCKAHLMLTGHETDNAC